MILPSCSPAVPWAAPQESHREGDTGRGDGDWPLGHPGVPREQEMLWVHYTAQERWLYL